MNKIILFVVIVGLVAAGWWYYGSVQRDQAVEATVSPSESFDPNFGDDGDEGGSIKQDVSLIVSESIVGKWQDTTDTKFIREFKTAGVVVDSYENKEVARGSWQVFNKEKLLAVGFTLESGVTYLQLTMSGTQSAKLNFKLSKLTPEELELIYMERGGVLRFKSVK